MVSSKQIEKKVWFLLPTVCFFTQCYNMLVLAYVEYTSFRSRTCSVASWGSQEIIDHIKLRNLLSLTKNAPAIFFDKDQDLSVFGLISQSLVSLSVLISEWTKWFSRFFTIIISSMTTWSHATLTTACPFLKLLELIKRVLIQLYIYAFSIFSKWRRFEKFCNFFHFFV